MHAITLCFLLLAVGYTNQQMLIKKLGNIAFIEKHWTITRELNITEYLENAVNLNKGINELIAACDDMKEKNSCRFQVDNFENNLDSIEANVNFIKTAMQSKQKRFLLTMVRGLAIRLMPIILVSLITSAAMVYAYTDKSMGNNTMTSIQLNLTEQHLQETSRMLEEKIGIDKERHIEEEKERRYKHALDMASISLIQHFRETVILSSIFENRMKDILFYKVNINEFLSSVDEVNKKLAPNHTLPRVDPLEMIELSTLSKTKNKTHIRIHIDIPILNVKPYDFYEYIPIPIKIGNETKILNQNTKHLFFNGSIPVEISREALEECIRVKNLTLCNSKMLESLEQRTVCFKDFSYKNNSVFRFQKNRE